jgi:hypothetical protein
MLPQTQIKKAQRLLGIKEEENIILFGKRLQGWIRRHGDATPSILKGINTILEDIHSQEIEKAKELKKINLQEVKNPLLRKYANEIIELYQEDLGVRKISQILWENHRAKISYSTIYNFLSSQGLIRKKEKVENG